MVLDGTIDKNYEKTEFTWYTLKLKDKAKQVARTRHIFQSTYDMTFD